MKRESLGYRLYRFCWTLLDWFYPPKCGGCGTLGERWCSDCQRKAQIVVKPICDCCGQKLTSKGFCQQCLKSKPNYTAVRSWAVFNGPLRSALHQLKYRRDIGLGDALALPMMDLVLMNEWDVDMVVPVPLGKARTTERGYNQAALLARPIALRLNLPYSSRALSRVRETRTQVGLSVIERRENVEGAFLANAAIVKGKHVLLVDDVTTSGSTLDACACALLDGGALTVFCVTLARSV